MKNFLLLAFLICAMMALGCSLQKTIGNGKKIAISTPLSKLVNMMMRSSEIEIDRGTISSWDQGFNIGEEQVWEASAGPYIFISKDLPSHK